MNYRDIKELLLSKEITLHDVIDAYIDITGTIGVGLISLGDGVQQYIQQHSIYRDNPKVILCDNCEEDLETHIDYHRCKAKHDSCIAEADCPDKINRCDCECNDLWELSYVTKNYFD